MRPRPFGQELPASLFFLPVFADGFELRARPENGTFGGWIEAVRIEHGPLVVIAQQHHLALHDQVDAFARIGTVADDVAQTINLGNIVFVDIVQNGGEAFQIAVDIADEGFHEDHSLPLRRMKLGRNRQPTGT